MLTARLAMLIDKGVRHTSLTTMVDFHFYTTVTAALQYEIFIGIVLKLGTFVS